MTKQKPSVEVYRKTLDSPPPRHISKLTFTVTDEAESSSLGDLIVLLFQRHWIDFTFLPNEFFPPLSYYTFRNHSVLKSE